MSKWMTISICVIYFLDRKDQEQKTIEFHILTRYLRANHQSWIKGIKPALGDQEIMVAKCYVICSALQKKTAAGPKNSQHPALQTITAAAKIKAPSAFSKMYNQHYSQITLI